MHYRCGHHCAEPRQRGGRACAAQRRREGTHHRAAIRSGGAEPTVIMLHGFNGSGAQIARGSGLDRLAPQSGVVAIFPDKHAALQGWNFFPSGKEPPSLIERTRATGIPDDVGYLKALIADLVRRGISDQRRVYLAGVSNGSFMVLRMICSNAGLLAAAGLVVGGMPEEVGGDCRPTADSLDDDQRHRRSDRSLRGRTGAARGDFQGLVCGTLGRFLSPAQWLRRHSRAVALAQCGCKQGRARARGAVPPRRSSSIVWLAAAIPCRRSSTSASCCWISFATKCDRSRHMIQPAHAARTKTCAYGAQQALATRGVLA